MGLLEIPMLYRASLHHRTETSNKVVEQASQSGQVITIRSERVVQLTRDCDHFVYY